MEEWDKGSFICHGQSGGGYAQTPVFADFDVASDDPASQQEYPDVQNKLNEEYKCDGCDK